MLIHAERMLHTDGTLRPGWLETDARTIRGVADQPPPGRSADRDVPLLVPGFVDLHCHGGGGGSFTAADRREVTQAVTCHRLAGTTTLLASLLTDTVPTLVRQVEVLAELAGEDLIAGIHLEGPWLSPLHPGAHDQSYLDAPTEEAVEALLLAANGTLRMVTIAPELDGGLAAIRRLASHDVLVAVGHTDADAARTAAAFEAGASVVTHLFNAMRPIHHRAPGVVPTALADSRVTVELIADGVHLHPDVLAMAARSAAGGFTLVTDAMAAAGAPDGEYLLGSRRVEVRDGAARLAGSQMIAGSTLTMHRALRTTVEAGVPLAAALVAATQRPARLLGRTDVGVLQAGARADLVALDDDLTLLDVMHAGSWLH